MKDIYKPRPISVVDKITPLQGSAWELENQAIHAKKAGSPDGAHYLLKQAAGLRTQDIHERLTVLFERADAQNAVIEVGLSLHKKKVPVFSYQGDAGDETEN